VLVNQRKSAEKSGSVIEKYLSKLVDAKAGNQKLTCLVSTKSLKLDYHLLDLVVNTAEIHH